MRWLRHMAGGLGAGFVLAVRWTSRIRFHNDPRPQLREAGRPYVYAFLHAHQLATVIAGEPGTGAMVSRSADGDLLVPSLLVRGIIPMRGSTRKGGRDKGGRQALEKMIAHSRSGSPTYFAVDGPRGPRNHVHRGIAELAGAAGAMVLPSFATASRRWILPRTWDRFQVPLPFGRIDVWFGEPIETERGTEASEAGEGLEQLRRRISSALDELEQQLDPAEANLAFATSNRPVAATGE